MTTTTHTVNLDGVGPVDVTVDEQGEGQPFFLLHGGGGPQTVAGIGELLATGHQARTISPIHPGFGGTVRPAALASIRGLAALYVALLDRLDLEGVTVVGNSIGGWIAAEMALLGHPGPASLSSSTPSALRSPGTPSPTSSRSPWTRCSSSASTTLTPTGSTPPRCPRPHKQSQPVTGPPWPSTPARP